MRYITLPLLFLAVFPIGCTTSKADTLKIDKNANETPKGGFESIAEKDSVYPIDQLSTSSDDSTYKEYCNNRFGFCMLVPKHFNQDPPPQNGDGAVFRSPDELSEIVLSGAIDNHETNLDDYFAWAQERLNVTYKAKKNNYFVVSGTKNLYGESMIVYTKTIFTEDIGGDYMYLTYQITYPKTQKDRYDSYCKLINERLK